MIDTTTLALRECRFCSKRIMSNLDQFAKHEFECLKNKKDVKALSKQCPRCGMVLLKQGSTILCICGLRLRIIDGQKIKAPEGVRAQPKSNKQGTDEQIIAPEIVTEGLSGVAYESYGAALSQGVAKEVARINTPVPRYSKLQKSVKTFRVPGNYLTKKKSKTQTRIKMSPIEDIQYLESSSLHGLRDQTKKYFDDGWELGGDLIVADIAGFPRFYQVVVKLRETISLLNDDIDIFAEADARAEAEAKAAALRKLDGSKETS